MLTIDNSPVFVEQSLYMLGVIIAYSLNWNTYQNNRLLCFLSSWYLMLVLNVSSSVLNALFFTDEASTGVLFVCLKRCNFNHSCSSWPRSKEGHSIHRLLESHRYALESPSPPLCCCALANLPLLLRQMLGRACIVCPSASYINSCDSIRNL